MNSTKPKRRGAVMSIVAAAAATTIAAASPGGPAPSPGPVASGSTPTDGGAALRATLDATRTLLFADYKSIDARSGLADTLSARLDIDEASLFSASMPAGASAAQFWDRNEAIVAFDRMLLKQLAAGKPDDLASVRGLDDIPLRTAAAGVLAPCAIVVPSTYEPEKAAPLVVLLHTQGVSEADELAEPLIRSLAEQTGAIIIAPYAGGDDERANASVQDVYAALDAAESSFAIDRKHVYLVGDGLGGVAAFDVALVRQDAWNGLMAIRSTMDASDTTRVAATLGGKAIYIVAGTADDDDPIGDVRRSIVWFNSVNIMPMYYEVNGATHDLGTLAPTIRQAWLDMFAGKRAVLAPPVYVPTPTPVPSHHP